MWWLIVYLLIGGWLGWFVWTNTREDADMVRYMPIFYRLFYALIVPLAVVFWPVLGLAMLGSILSSVVGDRTGRHLPLNATEEQHQKYEAYWARKRGEL